MSEVVWVLYCLAVSRSPGFRQFKVCICFLIFIVCVRFHLVLQTSRLLESCTLQEQSFCMRFGRFSIMLLEHVTIRLERTNGSSLSTFPEPHSQKQTLGGACPSARKSGGGRRRQGVQLESSLSGLVRKAFQSAAVLRQE